MEVQSQGNVSTPEVSHEELRQLVAEREREMMKIASRFGDCCSSCGSSAMIPTGSCSTCTVCGTSGGCS